jgi:RHS repeat-associated protein
LAHNNFCTSIVPQHQTPVLEKIVNTRGDGTCPGEATPTYSVHQIQNIQFSAESVGIVPGHPDMDNPKETVYDHLALFGLDAHKGVLDMRYKLPTEAGVAINNNEDKGCVKRSADGLVFYDVSAENSPRSIDRLHEIEGKVANSTGPQRAPRFNSQALFHWEVTAAQNSKGLRGSTPNTAVSRDYLLIGAGAYGMLIVEIGGTAPPSIASYSPLDESHLADVVWFAAGCYAIRVIPKTNLASVLDGNGHVLIVDLSNIDQRWLEPATPGVAAQPRALGEPFPLTHSAVIATPIDPFDVGVDDARIIYKSPYVYTTGVIPPIVDPQTGLSFGGDSITRDMRTAALFDPPVEVIADVGNNKLEPITGIVPLGVPAPPKDPSKKPTEDGYAFPKGALAAFRIRVTLPGDIAHALSDVEANQKLQFALESELMPGQLSVQTPLGTPQSHLRRSTRDGVKEDRAVDLVFKHEIQIDPSIDVDKDYRHQSSYNRLVSPWIVAIADPRASEHVVGDSEAKKKSGCVNCDRPDALHDLNEDKGVYELFTNGRTISIRPDSNTPETKMSDALKGAYKYLGEKGRLELHIPTTMADTVRGPALTVSAQAPPVANGALSETTYVHSGEVEINASDMTIPGRAGNDVAVARTYRSRTIGSTVLGMNWEAPFLRRVRQLPNGNVEYRDGAGEVWTFTPQTTKASGSSSTAADTLDQQFGTKIRYISPKGLYLKLARNENGWMLYDRQWRIARFDNYGRLTSISDEFWQKAPSGSLKSTTPVPPKGDLGNTTFYAYDATGRLTSIVDSVGRETKLKYWDAPADPKASDYNCTKLGERGTPCKYAGLLKSITDWRGPDPESGREVLFEYDLYGRLIGVQRPKVKGPQVGGDAQGPPEAASNDSDARRPRVSYEYEKPTAPSTTEALHSATYTKFMNHSGDLSKIFDAAENDPTVSSPRARVTFDYWDLAGDAKDDRVQYQHWPCGDFDGTTCQDTKATFNYTDTTATVTDMLGQERDYDIIDLPGPTPLGGGDPDPQLNRFRHISKETVKDVPVLEKTAPPVTFSETATPIPFITNYSDFDDEGGVKFMTQANGTTVQYDTEAAKNGAAGLILDKITESGGGAQRITQYIYDSENPNSANTPVKISRNDGTGPVERDAQSGSHERKTVQNRDADQKVQSKTESTFDDYSRPTKVARYKSDDPNSQPNSGQLVEQRTITYKDGESEDNLAKGRVDHVKTEDGALDTQVDYTSADVNGQTVTSTDQKRNITTITDYDAQDRPIHVKVTDVTGLLTESWTGYDASGRLIYSAHQQSPIGRVEAFSTYDPLGRILSVRTTKNKVKDFDAEVAGKKEYSVSQHKITSYDPAAGIIGARAKTIATIDNLGRTESTERQMLDVAVPPATQQTENAKFAYDRTGQLSYATDTVRSAAVTAHDAFGRATASFSVDGLQSKSMYDAWDQVTDQQALDANNGVMAHDKEKYTATGHMISHNEQVNASGSAPARYRQTFNIWQEGGKKTGVRLGPAPSLTGDLNTPDVRATVQEIDAAGRLTSEIYGSATGVDGEVFPMHEKKIETSDFIGDAPQKTIDVASMRGGAQVITNVTFDGFNRVKSTTVANTYTTVTAYDEVGNVTNVTPPAGVGTIDRKFDSRGLAYREIRDGETVSNFFDERGMLSKYRDESGKETNYIVDPLGRISQIQYPDLTTEQVIYEDKTGLMLAHKDRKDVWLAYSYDQGGRTTAIHGGNSQSSPVITSFEYDNLTKRLTRVANKDGAIVFRDYDFLGRPSETVTYRYKSNTGLDPDPAKRQVLDVHVQTHAWSIFAGERLGWRMPVAGPDAGLVNAAAWLTDITETRDASTNVTQQLRGTGDSATPIIVSGPGGVGELLTRTRMIGTQGITSTYAYADSVLGAPMSSGLPPDPQTGGLRSMETQISAIPSTGPPTGPALAGSEIFHNSSGRIGFIRDLAFTDLKSAFTYDPRGRLATSKLLVPQSALSTATPITDHHTESAFRDLRDTAGTLSSTDIANLGQSMALKAEPPKWTTAEGLAHDIASKTLYLNGAALLQPGKPYTYEFKFEGGRRTSDGVWTSTFDEFGRMTKAESTDRVIEYVYDPRGRVIGRTASQKTSGGNIPEARVEVLNGDGLPAETTWVWDPVVDRLVAVYEAGKSTATGAAPDAGLLRQYLHGDRGYDDPVEMLIARHSGDAPEKYFPIFDEAGTDSLQAVLDKDGNVVERVLYGDSYGDAPHYLQGPHVQKVTFASQADGSADIRIHASESVKQLTLTNGVRLVSLRADGSVAATSTAVPTLESNTIIHWHLSSAEWTALTPTGATQLQIAVASSLRTYGWGDVPFSAVPEFARTLYSAKSDANLPVIVTDSLSHLASLSSEEPLYEIKSLYMAGLDYSKTKLLTGFHALPYSEPANGLIFVRARWYDPSTGTFLSPDPMGYHDASSLYAFAGGDPVNRRDPDGDAVSVSNSGTWVVTNEAGKIVVVDPWVAAEQPLILQDVLTKFGGMSNYDAKSIMRERGLPWTDDARRPYHPTPTLPHGGRAGYVQGLGMSLSNGLTGTGVAVQEGPHGDTRGLQWQPKTREQEIGKGITDIVTTFLFLRFASRRVFGGAPTAPAPAEVEGPPEVPEIEGVEPTLLEAPGKSVIDLVPDPETGMYAMRLPGEVPVGAHRVPGHHNALVAISDASGALREVRQLSSANMTEFETIWPKWKGLGAHTEVRITTRLPLFEGETMVILGELPPCPTCKGYMNRAASHYGATIKYMWWQDGKLKVWTANEKK